MRERERERIVVIKMYLIYENPRPMEKKRRTNMKATHGLTLGRKGKGDVFLILCLLGRN